MDKIVAFLVILLAPFIIGYAIAMFVCWGEFWYPGDWQIETRIITALGFILWLFTCLSVVSS